MISVGMVWDEIVSIVRDKSKDTLIDIKRSCQMSYYHLIKLMPWQEVRLRIEVTLSSTAAYLLPGDMAGVEKVFDRTNAIEYSPGVRWGNTIRSAWFFLEPIRDPLALLRNITVESTASAWTGGTWDSSYIGEYIRFDKEPGIYLITGERTFTPRYYGPRISSLRAAVRPAGTKQLACVDDNGDRVAGAMDIYYWIYPSPLYEDFQDILLPASRPLELDTAIRMLGTKDRRDNAADRLRGDYTRALEEMKSMNPRFIQQGSPTNRVGAKAFDMNHRGGSYVRY